MTDRRRKRKKSRSNQSVIKHDKTAAETLERLQKISKAKQKEIKGTSLITNKVLVVGLLTSIVFISAFIFINTNHGGTSLYTIPEGQKLPANLPSRNDPNLTSDSKISEAYAYALENGELLEQLICYCGCYYPVEQPLHENNKECFWTETGAKDTHAENCVTCVYIALSAKALNEAGWTPQQIRDYIDSQYT